jgi:hypothetical protein
MRSGKTAGTIAHHLHGLRIEVTAFLQAAYSPTFFRASVMAAHSSALSRSSLKRVPIMPGPNHHHVAAHHFTLN